MRSSGGSTGHPLAPLESLRWLAETPGEVQQPTPACQQANAARPSWHMHAFQLLELPHDKKTKRKHDLDQAF